jgi:hypothetical protein
MTQSMASFRLGIDEVQLIDDINTLGHPARRAYYTGLEQTDRELRQQLLDLMRAGSPAALSDCQQRIDRCLSEIQL